MLYCLWVTLPEEDDNFIIETTKPFPNWKNMSEKEQKQFIREQIRGKSNEELVKVHFRDGLLVKALLLLTQYRDWFSLLYHAKSVPGLGLHAVLLKFRTGLLGLQ